VQPPLFQTFPFPSTLGEVALHLPSPDGLFIYSSCGKHPFPLLQWSFPHTTTYKLSHSWLLGGAAPAFSSQLVYLQFSEGFPSPTLRHSGRPALFATCLCCCCCCCCLFRFFFPFFPWVGVGLSRGLCSSGPGLSVGVPCVA
jgi:hypothetical protein